MIYVLSLRPDFAADASRRSRLAAQPSDMPAHDPDRPSGGSHRQTQKIRRARAVRSVDRHRRYTVRSRKGRQAAMSEFVGIVSSA